MRKNQILIFLDIFYVLNMYNVCEFKVIDTHPLRSLTVNELLNEIILLQILSRGFIRLHSWAPSVVYTLHYSVLTGCAPWPLPEVPQLHVPGPECFKKTRIRRATLLKDFVQSNLTWQHFLNLKVPLIDTANTVCKNISRSLCSPTPYRRVWTQAGAYVGEPWRYNANLGQSAVTFAYLSPTIYYLQV